MELFAQSAVLKKIKDEEIEWVDLRFTDPKGKWQHLTMVASVLGEDELTDGLMFDGSSIEGWKAINESDMILKPDLDAVFFDPFSATPMMILEMEMASGDAIRAALQPGWVTVGTEVDIRHLAAALVGATVASHWRTSFPRTVAYSVRRR